MSKSLKISSFAFQFLISILLQEKLADLIFFTFLKPLYNFYYQINSKCQKIPGKTNKNRADANLFLKEYSYLL